MKVRITLTGSIVLAGVALWAVLANQRVATRVVPTDVQQQPSPAERRAEALRKGGGLKELAAVTGEYVTEIPGVEGGATTIGELVKASSVVLVGRTASNRSRVSPRGDMIYSAYKFDVESVLKGEQPGPTVTVVLIGGRVVFEDGSVAERRVAKTERPIQYERYLLFLRRPLAPAEGDPNIYEPEEFVPVLDSHGLFRLPGGGARVEPADRRGRGIADEIATMRPGELISAVQRAVRSGR